MNDQEISSPQELDATLVGNAMSKHSKLWKEAEGRSIRWAEGIALVASCLMFLSGLVAASQAEVGSAVIHALIGAVVFLSVLIGLLMRQVKALSELVRKLEDVSRSGPTTNRFRG